MYVYVCICICIGGGGGTVINSGRGWEVGKSVRGAGLENMIFIMCVIIRIDDFLSGRGSGSFRGQGELITVPPPGGEEGGGTAI